MQSGDVSPVPQWWSSLAKRRLWRATAGQAAQAGEPCPFETKQRVMARGSQSASAKGPGLFPPAMKRKKDDWKDRGKWEQQQIPGTPVLLFVWQQRAYDILYSFTVGRSEVSSGTSVALALLCSQSHHHGLQRFKDGMLFPIYEAVTLNTAI